MGHSTSQPDDFFHPPGFLLSVPVWSVGRKDRGISGILTAPHPESGKLSALLFTDEDLAQRFLHGHAAQASSHALQRIDTSLAVLGLLTVLETIGVVHVLIDVSKKTQTFTVAEIKDAILQSLL